HGQLVVGAARAPRLVGGIALHSRRERGRIRRDGSIPRGRLPTAVGDERVGACAICWRAGVGCYEPPKPAHRDLVLVERKVSDSSRIGGIGAPVEGPARYDRARAAGFTIALRKPLATRSRSTYTARAMRRRRPTDRSRPVLACRRVAGLHSIVRTLRLHRRALTLTARAARGP